MKEEREKKGPGPRNFPYIWPTWISGIISGDEKCRWKPWFKAHNYYEELADPEREKRMTQFSETHARMVDKRVADLTAAGYRVTVEDQNKLYLKGNTTQIGGCPDIVIRFDHGGQRVEDCKSGRKRDSDYWQVVIYGVVKTLLRPALKGRINGAIIYRGSEPDTFDVREISHTEILAGHKTVVDQILETGGSIPPPVVPSGYECSRCNIACCTARVESSEEEGTTEEF